LRTVSEPALAASQTDDPSINRETRAEADITDAALWYDGRERGLGLELISEVRSAIARALKNPESFTHLRRIQRCFVFSLDDSSIVFFIDRQDALVFFSLLQSKA
jgi:hypothetical protein